MKWSYAKLAFAVIALAGLVRFALALYVPVSGDACWHFAVSRFTADNFSLPLFESFGTGNRNVFWAPPLFHVIGAVLYRLFGETGVRLLSPLAGTLTLVFTFLIAKKLFREKTAFFATLFMAVVPVHLYYSTLGFTDVLVTFFIISTAYFLLVHKALLAAVLFGLALLSKHNAVFSAPLFAFMFFSLYKQRAEAVKRASLFFLTSGLIGSIWFIRNVFLLGNPVWPFLYALFGGVVQPTDAELGFSLFNLFHPGNIIQGYLSFFGVPLGNPGLLFAADIPLKLFVLAGWFLATLLFLVPFFFGMRLLPLRDRKARLLWLWIGVNLAGFSLYIMSLGDVYARLALPLFPALAIFWALGVERMLSFSALLKKFLIVVLLGIVLVFVAAETGKAFLAAQSWSPYEDDFAWVRSSTPENSFVYYRGQCLSYHVNRQSGFLLDREEAYLWLPEHFPVEPFAELNLSILESFSSHALLYHNPATTVSVYHVAK